MSDHIETSGKAKKTWWKRWWAIALGILVVLMVIGALAPSDEKQNAAPASTAAPPTTVTVVAPAETTAVEVAETTASPPEPEATTEADRRQSPHQSRSLRSLSAALFEAASNLAAGTAGKCGGPRRQRNGNAPMTSATCAPHASTVHSRQNGQCYGRTTLMMGRRGN